jgi:hypothetical protein
LASTYGFFEFLSAKAATKQQTRNAARTKNRFDLVLGAVGGAGSGVAVTGGMNNGVSSPQWGQPMDCPAISGENVI